MNFNFICMYIHYLQMYLLAYMLNMLCKHDELFLYFINVYKKHELLIIK